MGKPCHKLTIPETKAPELTNIVKAIPFELTKANHSTIGVLLCFLVRYSVVAMRNTINTESTQIKLRSFSFYFLKSTLSHAIRIFSVSSSRFLINFSIVFTYDANKGRVVLCPFYNASVQVCFSTEL